MLNNRLSTICGTASGMVKAFNTIRPGNTQKAMLANPPVATVKPPMNTPSSKPRMNASH